MGLLDEYYKKKKEEVSENKTTKSNGLLNEYYQSKNTDTSVVNNDYYNTFLNEAKDFHTNFNDPKSDNTRYKTWQGLNSKLNTLKVWLRQNKNKITEESYNSISETIGSLDSYSNYFADFKTEDDYLTAMKGQRDYEGKASSNIEEGRKEISKLESQYGIAKAFADELNSWTEATNDGEDFFSNYHYLELERKYREESKDPKVYMKKAQEEYKAYVESLKKDLTNALGDFKSVDEMGSLIANKRAYYNHAEYIQNGIKMNSVSDPKSENYDPQFTTYSQKGKETVNGDPGFAMIALYWKDEMEQMTDDEWSTYYYHVGKGGINQGTEYLKANQETFSYRVGKKKAEEVDTTVGKLFFGLEAGLNQFGTGVANLFKDDNYFPANSTQVASGIIREDMAEDGWGWAYDLVNTTGNMVPSIITSTVLSALNPVVGQVAGATLMGASAAGNAYAEAINLGYAKDQAAGYSLLVGGSEAGLQYLLGGIGSLGGAATKGITTNIATALASNFDKAFAKIITTTGVKLVGNMVSEFGEEYLQEILTPVFKNIALGTNEDFKLYTPDALYAGFLGALSAGLLEGGSTIAGEVRTYRAGKNVVSSGQTSNLVDFVKTSYDLDSVAYKIADKVTESTDAYTIGQLLYEAGASLNEQNVADIARQLESKGVLSQDAQTIAKWLYKSANSGGSALSGSQIEALKNNPVLSEVMQEIVLEKSNSVNKRTSEYQGILDAMKTSKAKANMVKALEKSGVTTEDATKIAEKLLEGKASDTEASELSVIDENLSQSKYDVSEDGKTYLTETGKAVEVKQIESISESGEANLTVDDGMVVKASDVSFGSDVEAAFIGTIADVKIGNKPISAKAANALYHEAMTALKGNPEMTVSEATSLVRGLAESYIYGAYKFDAAKLTETNEDGSAKRFAGELTDTQRNFAYNLGTEDSISNAKSDQSVIDSLVEKAKAKKEASSNPTTSKKGSVRFEDGVVAKGKLQKRTVSLAKHLAKIIGIDIVFYDARTTRNTEGQKANGFFDEDTDTIYLDLQNSHDDAKTIAFTLSHELVHFIKKWSPEKFDIFAKFLMEQYTAHGVDSTQLLNKKMTDLETTDKDLAYVEMICDACETMLLDSNAVYKLMELRKADLELFDKIKLHIHELLNKIRNMYKSLGLNPSSDEAKALLEMKDVLEKLYALFEDAAVDAVQSYQAVQNSNEAIFGEATVDIGKTESGVKNQLKNHKKIGEDATAYNERHKNVHKAILQVGIESMYEMAETMLPYLEQEGILPPDIPGKTIFKNGSYGKTGENTTLCVRTLTYEDFKDRVAEKIGRPLSVAESLLVSQKIYDIATDPQCIYCYVAADRKAYDEKLGEYWNAMDKYIKAMRNGGDSQALYTEYLAGRKDTSHQKRRWSMWESIAKSGNDYISAKDLTTKRKRDAIIAKKNAFSEQIKDAQRYAQNASWAKTVYDYRAYKGDILKMTSKFVDMLNSEYGLRMYSFSDYTPAFIVENMQMLIDASVKGLKSLAYTKDTDYAEIFASTGQAINVSCFAKYDKDLGTYVEDNRQGANWEKTKNLRKQYRNVGAVMVATNDAMVEWALKQDWVDVVIPYHIVKTGTTIANEYQWNNYTSESADRVGNKTANIYPTEHNNDFATYSNLLNERGITPRFSRWYDMVANGELTENQYMKLVNEVRLPASELSAVVPSFNLEAAKRSFGIDNDGNVIEGGFVDKGGYMGGWYREGVDVNQEVMAVSEDIKAGKSSLDVDYGMSKASKEKVEARYKKQAKKKNNENFVEDKYFKSQMQKWGSLSHGTYVKVGDIKEEHPLVKVGMPQGIIRYDVDKLNKNMGKHKYLDTDLLKEIPNIIANPVAISEYTEENTVSVFGEVFVGNSPMMVGVTISKDRSGADISKVRTFNARRDVGTLITDDTVLYLDEDKKRTREWFQACGIQVPLGETKFGFIRSISQKEKSVKKQLKKSSSSYAPTFYSQMGKVIGEMKQNKIGANDVVRYLIDPKRGVKAEEIRWSGIVPFLEGKKSVTKQELLDFINSSMLQIGEKEITGDGNPEHLEDFYSQMEIVLPLFSSEEIEEMCFDYDGDFSAEKFKSALEEYVEEGDVSEFDFEDAVERAEEMEEKLKSEGTHWSQYKLEGGSNYREIVFTLPNSSYSNNMMRVHWGDDAEGVLVHARIQDFDVDGKKMLFIEEIQSDWHNEGHKDGYQDDSQLKELQELEAKANEAFYALEDYSTELTGLAGEYKAVAKTQKGRELLREKIRAEKELKQAQAKFDTKVPDAPFKDNYHEYVLKRLLRMAAEEGYDSIGWTPSEIQVERWSDEFAEGYRIEYDQDMPKFLRKYGRQWGAKVDTAKIASPMTDSDIESRALEILSEKGIVQFHWNWSHEYGLAYEQAKKEMSQQSKSVEVWSMDITDLMKDSVLHEGQTLYQKKTTSNRTILANSLESAAQNDIERNKLAEYKKKISLIEAEEKRLSEIQKQLFTKGAVEPEQRKALQFEAKQISNRINTYDRQLLRLEATTALNNVLTREKALARKKQKQIDAEILKGYKEKAAKTTRELMDRNRESRKKATESRNKTAMRHKIKTVVNDLNTLLLKPSKERHVPEELRIAVAEALKVVNMDTVGADERIRVLNEKIAKAKDPDIIASLTETRDRILKQGNKLSEKLGKLKEAYEMVRDSTDDSLSSIYDEVIYNKIGSVQKKIGNTPLRNMTLEQLESVHELYTAILTIVRDSNKAFAENLRMTRQALGSNTFTEIKENNKSRDRIKHESVERFGWKYLKPMQAMKTIGSETLQKLWNNILYGQEVFAQDYDEAVKFAKEMKEKYGYKKWDLNKLYSFESKSGKVMKINLEQMMSIYAYSKRHQADEHIEYGGILLDGNLIKVKEKNKLGIPVTVEYKINDRNAYRLNKMQVDEIVATLEKEFPGAKDFVDDMQKYLSETMGEKGNEVSMKMYGIRLFKEEHYFPLKSSKDFMEAANAKLKGDVKIKNKGMTKSTVEHARNPIVLENFLDVWGNHINEMALYHGLVLPLEDFSRTLNYSFQADEKLNTDAESIKTALGSAFGDNAENYLNELLNAINGGVLHDSSAGFADNMISKFKKAKVMASLSVIIQQPTAIIRAMGIIDPKYFVAQNFNHKSTWEELKKYCPTAIIKETGSFDTNMGRTIVDMIKDDRGFTDKVGDFLGKAPAYMDEVGWNMIWRALKNKVATEQKLSGEALLKECGKQMTLIINETQVYDSVLSRNEFMRSKNALPKMATAFMAEPTTVANMIYGAVLDAKRGKKGVAAKTVAAVISSVVVNGLVSALVYAFRDDDEDETLLEKYISSATTEVLDGLNPLTYIPFVKDAYSIAQGYKVERADMSLVQDVFDAVNGFYNVLDSEAYEGMNGKEIAKHIYENSVPLLTSICDMFGLPVGNVLRDAKAIIVNDNAPLSQTSSSGTRYAFKEGFLDTLPKIIQKIIGTDTKQDKLYKAVIDGDTSCVDRLKSGYKDEDAYETALRKALRENDPRIKKAAEAKLRGDYDEYERLFDEIEAEGNFEFGTIKATINTEFNNLDEDDESDESSNGNANENKAESIYSTSDINNAFENGDTSSALEIIDDIVRVKTENYINDGEKKQDAEKKAKSSVKSSMSSYWKPLYIAAYKNKDNEEMKRIRNILLASGLYGRANDVVKTGQEWIKSSK